MSSEVGSGQVAIFPTFKGFRKAVTTETDGSAKAGSAGFKKAFSRTGSDAGKTTGKGFKAAFDSSAAGTSDKVTAQLQANVAKASKALSDARLRQQDAAGKVTVAEAKLREAQKKYATDSSQVIGAVERLNSATRKLNAANEVTESSTDSLKTAQKRLADAADQAGSQFQQTGATWGTRLKSGFSAVFTGSFLGNIAANIASFVSDKLRDGVRATVDLVQTSISAASDLQQSVGAVDAVFGKYADSVHKQAKSAARDVGLSKNEYNTLATVLGAQLKNLGTPIDQVSTKTSDLIKLGADLSAQFGGKTSDAVEAVSSLLRGERDPIEKYGVSLKQASIDAEASRLGFKAVGGQFDNNAQSLATLSLLYKQTADAQGTFSRENDTLAHKQQVQAALWANVQAKIGDAFLPVATKLSDIMATKVIPVISKLVDKYGPMLASTFEDAIPSFEKMAQDVLPQLPDLFKSIGDALPAIIQGIQVAAPLFVVWAQNGSAVLSVFSAFFGLLKGDTSIDGIITKLEGLGGPLGSVVGWALRAAQGFGAAVGSFVQSGANLANSIRTGVDTAVSWVSGLPGRIAGYFASAGSWLVSSGRAVIQGFIDGIRQMFKPVGDAVSGILSFVQDHFPHSPAKTGPFSGSGWTDIESSGESLMEQFNRGALNATWRMPAPGQLTAAGVSASPVSSTAGGLAPTQTVRETIQIVLSGRVLAEAIRQYQRSNS